MGKICTQTTRHQATDVFSTRKQDNKDKPTLSRKGNMIPKPSTYAGCFSIKYKHIFKQDYFLCQLNKQPCNEIQPIHKGIKIKEYEKRRCGKMTEVQD